MTCHLTDRLSKQMKESNAKSSSRKCRSDPINVSIVSISIFTVCASMYTCATVPKNNSSADTLPLHSNKIVQEPRVLPSDTHIHANRFCVSGSAWRLVPPVNCGLEWPGEISCWFSRVSSDGPCLRRGFSCGLSLSQSLSICLSTSLSVTLLFLSLFLSPVSGPISPTLP